MFLRRGQDSNLQSSGHEPDESTNSSTPLLPLTLFPPWESGPCLSPSVADHPKRPAKHHWLGQPLPDQLPNTTQAHQTALLSFLQDLARTVRQIPTRYAPVRHFVLNYSDSSKRRRKSRSARPVVLKQGETTLARSLFSFCPAPRKQRSTCMC